ncbi:probable E3 ubiquitin-protein ligase HERC4 [Danio aesculapii]|uniref:probable E3 ubiquitin-protein ligase HERC4 n=1 Tax=Danio aesculapii TaxID=1142201 RepID=UPI0024C0D5B6|nr:probable E3 ubiquitin-protein ligase HERC4 [Danio aesculapii]
MLCYWGAQVREGFGLPDKVSHGKGGIKSVCPKSAVQDMSAGKSFVGFIRDGKVSVLRLRDEDSDQDGELKQLELKKDRIRLIVCGEDGAVLLAYGGKVLAMDKSTVCRTIVDNRQVIQIACGDQHSMALTNDGQLFVWGENAHGQLGMRKEQAGTQSPQHLQSLCGIPVAQISAGGNHSFVLSLSGVVFGWGSNSAGQLGLGDTTDRFVPTTVKSLNGKKTVSISCGGEHTATLSKGGTVFTFGSGGFGQLGHNSFKDEHHPRLVAELWGSKVSKVTCGRHHTLVLVASTNRIYSFGCGMQGQLGTKKLINQSLPFPVCLPTECNQTCRIEKLIAGENHSFVLLFKDHGNQSKPNPSRGILTLDDRMIKRWVSGTDPWKVIKKDINKVFSSAASLNGSFLKTSCDEHYQTSVEQCGLDFDLVKTSFAKLSTNETVILEAVKVVQRALLSLNPIPAGAEALRIYLLLPELINCLQKPQIELTEALASKILDLNPAVCYVLEMYWSKLPDVWLKTLVDIFKKASGDLISSIASVSRSQHIARLPQFVMILQMLYKVCCNANRNITKSDFIIHEINFLLDVLQTTYYDMNNNWLKLNLTDQINPILAQQMYYQATLHNLISLPCIFNLEAKCSFMKNRVLLRSLELVLRRTALLEDCFHQLRDVSKQHHHLGGCRLSVFYTEDLKRTDVNKRDFFLNVFKELCMPDFQLLMYNDSQTLSWFPSKLTVEKENYFLFGILCGLAFNNCSVVNLPFPLALFKKLLNVKPSLEDLAEFDPGLGRSLQYILSYSDDVEELDTYFTIAWDGAEVELDPVDPGKQVTNSNRSKFVDKYVDHIFNKSVEEVFEEFRRGFFTGCEKHLVEMFEPEELRGVMVGNEEYDWNILKQNAKYEGSFYVEHPTIISFWEVFDKLTANQKKAFLLFLTGFDRVPILGMSAVKMRVTHLANSTEDHLPEALTCYALLQLPEYKKKKTLRAKVIKAISHKRGFWEE